MNLSKQEAEFLSRLLLQGKSIISLNEAEKVWQGPTPGRVALHRLEKKGWLQRLEQGIYLVIPLEAGPERLWSESPLVIAQYLIQPAAVAYWTALHYWQMTEQIPRVTFIQSTKQKQPVEIQGMHFQFVFIKKERFFGIVKRQAGDKKFEITDREKTLIDCADRPELSGGIAQLSQAIQNEYSQIDWDRMDDYLERWGGGTVVKRIGYLIDALKVPIPERDDRLERWKALLSKGISLLEPGAGRQGPIVTPWRIRVNIQSFTTMGEG